MYSKEQILASYEPKLAPNAEAVVRKRYMKLDAEGRVAETVPEMFYRVAEFMASADAQYVHGDFSETTKDFYQMIASLDFLPGGRAFFEAGNSYTGQMASCFVFPIEDSLDEIFQTLKDAAITQKNNGGCGFNFSKIRQKGASVKNVPGVACGPVHYLKTFDAAFSQILQGSKRHGGNMGVLNADHPDIREFINLKGRDSSVKNFNISVGVTDAFMEAVRDDRPWDLKEPHTGKTVETILARELFSEIVNKAWECADPGLLFLDAIERGNRNHDIARMNTTNPCGEQPLLPYESCNLGSFHLGNFVRADGGVDWERLRLRTWSAVRFLDNMITLNKYPVAKISQAVEKTRKIGIGVMGFAHMLYKMGIPYQSEEAVALIGGIMKFINEEGLRTSCELAKVRGVFSSYETSTFAGTGIRPRNSMITSIAPTGTISLFANTTSGIEPQFSLVSIRNTFFEGSGKNTATQSLLYVDEIFEAAAREHGFYSEELMKKIAEEGTIQHMHEIPQNIKDVFVTAHDVAPLWHVRIQAAAQQYTDAGVSKTINMPNDAQVSDVREVYINAYTLGCKGITIYRDGSKEDQVLNVGNGGAKKEKPEQVVLKTENEEKVSSLPQSSGDEQSAFAPAELQRDKSAFDPLELQPRVAKGFADGTRDKAGEEAERLPSNDDSDWIYSQQIPLSRNAMTVLEKRAFLKDDRGNIKETPEELFRRVSHAVAGAEKAYGKSESEIRKIEDDFYRMLSALEFVPGQALRNAGSGDDLTLSACLVLPIEDNMESILTAISENVIAHRATCGTGFNYSHLRPKGSLVRNVGNIAAGPVAFMRAVSAAQKTVWTKGGRQQGSMGILNVDHPDIRDFIVCKDDLTSFDNMNISVGITNEFMDAVKNDTEYDLKNPADGSVVRREKARDILRLISEHAWISGDPGVIFVDRIEATNPTPSLGKLEATNPCGEQPLLPYETCNLGSLVLSRMLKPSGTGYEIDWEKLKNAVRVAVRFLDNTIDVNRYPFEKITEMSKKTRRIGLGVMGFSDMLIRLHIAYNSETAVQLAGSIMQFIDSEAREMSVLIAEEKGSFPAFELSVWPSRGYRAMRNSAITTIAPTGYTSIVAGCSSGIEPVFALAFRRMNSMGGHDQYEVHQYFKEVARRQGFYSEALMQKIAESGSVQNIPEVPAEVKRVFVVSYDIDTQWDVKIQAAFQKYTDNAVSKTINLKNSASVEDIESVYRTAYELGCKGVTIYRDGSKDQVLVTGTAEKEKKQPASAEPEAKHAEQNFSATPRQPRERPEVVQGSTYKLKTSYGNLFITINSDEAGQPFEVFATIGKSGGFFAVKTDAIGRLISLALRSGIEAEAIIAQLKGIRGPMPSWGKNGMIHSIPDAIAQVLEEHLRKPQPQLELSFSHEAAEQKKLDEPQAVLVEELIKQNEPEEEKVSAPVASVSSVSSETVSQEAPKKKNSYSSMADAGFAPECPECGGVLEFGEGCMMCRGCGFSKCG